MYNIYIYIYIYIYMYNIYIYRYTHQYIIYGLVIFPSFTVFHWHHPKIAIP